MQYTVRRHRKRTANNVCKALGYTCPRRSVRWPCICIYYIRRHWNSSQCDRSRTDYIGEAHGKHDTMVCCVAHSPQYNENDDYRWYAWDRPSDGRYDVSGIWLIKSIIVWRICFWGHDFVRCCWWIRIAYSTGTDLIVGCVLCEVWAVYWQVTGPYSYVFGVWFNHACIEESNYEILSEGRNLLADVIISRCRITPKITFLNVRIETIFG